MSSLDLDPFFESSALPRRRTRGPDPPPLPALRQPMRLAGQERCGSGGRGLTMWMKVFCTRIASRTGRNGEELRASPRRRCLGFVGLVHRGDEVGRRCFGRGGCVGSGEQERRIIITRSRFWEAFLAWLVVKLQMSSDLPMASGG